MIYMLIELNLKSKGHDPFVPSAINHRNRKTITVIMTVFVANVSMTLLPFPDPATMLNQTHKLNHKIENLHANSTYQRLSESQKQGRKSTSTVSLQYDDIMKREMLSESLALCEGNQLCFLWSQYEHTVGQTVKVLIIWMPWCSSDATVMHWISFETHPFWTIEQCSHPEVWHKTHNDHLKCSHWLQSRHQNCLPSEVQWHSSWSNFTRDTSVTNH